MKYTTEITIDLPRERVTDLFADPDNLSKWQPGLQSLTHLSGEPGETGAQSRMVYDMNGRTIELTETIIANNLPEWFEAHYVAQGVENRNLNRFYADGANRTRWVQESTFKFNGFMRLAGLFFRGSFPKQTRQNMQQFKDFAESNSA